MTPSQLKAVIQQMVDKTCEAHIRLVIDRLDNILQMCERDGGLPRAREILSLYKPIYGEPLRPEPLISFMRNRPRPSDGRFKPMSEEHKAKIREAKANSGIAERNQEIIKMVEAGHGRGYIASKFGLTPARISQIYIRSRPCGQE